MSGFRYYPRSATQLQWVNTKQVGTIVPKRWFLLFTFPSPFFPLPSNVFLLFFLIFSLLFFFCYSFSSRVPNPDFFPVSDSRSRIQILDPGVQKAPDPQHCRHPVLRIHDILGWIRIRIRGSMSLTNGSGSCYFRHWPLRCQQNKFFNTIFSAYWRYIYIIFQR